MTETAVRISEAQDRAAWLKERRKGIGGSDVAAVLGLSPWRTPYQVWAEKTDRVEKLDAGMAALFGHEFEEFVAKEFCRRLGLQVQRVNSMLCAGEGGWMRANIDRAIVNPQISRRVRVLDAEKAAEAGRLLTTDRILECKTASVFMTDQWGPSQEEEIKAGDVYSEHKIPLYYETQVQWYLGITGAVLAYVAVLIGNSDFRIYEVKRDDEVIKALVEQCGAFWRGHVLADVPPDPVNVEDVKRIFQKDDGEMREASNEEATDIGELKTVRAQIKSLQEQEKAIASRIILAIGKNAGLTIGGQKAVTYKAQTTRRFDTGAFKLDKPTDYADYVRETTTRVLRVS